MEGKRKIALLLCTVASLASFIKFINGAPSLRLRICEPLRCATCHYTLLGAPFSGLRPFRLQGMVEPIDLEGGAKTYCIAVHSSRTL